MTEGYEALRRGAGILDLSSRGRIMARGRDRARLLHNLTSNEVKKMAPGSGCYAFLLSAKGRIEADLYLWCFAEHFLIDTEPELREKVMAHIKRYIIADQVELEDVTDQTSSIGVEGPGAAAVLEAIGAPATASHLTETADHLTETGQPGGRIFCPAGEAAGVVERLKAAGAKMASAEDARVVRIENGKPRYGEDIRETSLVQETQQMHAVSFNKGCYLGQEIVERVRAQGHVNKKLVRLEVDGAETLAPGTKLKAGDAEAGEITSAVYSPELGKVAAIGVVRTTHAIGGAIFSLPSSLTDSTRSAIIPLSDQIP